MSLKMAQTNKEVHILIKSMPQYSKWHKNRNIGKKMHLKYVLISDAPTTSEWIICQLLLTSILTLSTMAKSTLQKKERESRDYLVNSN